MLSTEDTTADKLAMEPVAAEKLALEITIVD